MATETTLSDHHSPDTIMDKVEEEERQTIKLEDVDPPKEVGGKDVEEKLDAEGLGGPQTPVEKLEETAGTILPASAQVEKVEEDPVVDVHVGAYSEKTEDCAPIQESLSAPGPGDEAAETLSGDPEKQSIVVEKSDSPSLEDIPAEVDLKVVESSVLNPEPDSAPKTGEMPEENSIDVPKVENDAPVVVETPTETCSEVAENPAVDLESSSASEPEGEIVGRKLKAPEEDTTEVEKVDDASVVDVPAEAGSNLIEKSVPEPESSPSEPIGVVVESLSEEHHTVVEKVDDATVVGVPREAGLEAIENPVLDPESSSSKTGDEMVERQIEALEEHLFEVEKVDDTEAGETKMETSSINAESSSPLEPSGENVQSKLEVTNEHLSTEIVETREKEQVAAEATEQPEEKPSVGTAAEPVLSIETVHKPVECLEDIPAKESESEVAKVQETSSEAECKTAENRELETKLEETVGADVIKAVEEETKETKASESSGGEVLTSEGTMVDKCEVNETLREEETSLDQEVHIDDKEEEGDSSNGSQVIEKAIPGPTDKEESGSEVVEMLPKDETMVAAKVEEDKEEKNVKIENIEGKSTKVEESIQTETAGSDERNGSAEVPETDRKQVSRDVEVVAEMQKMEHVKEDTPLSAEADKDKDGEVKLSEVDAKETAENNATNLDGAKEDSEIAKPNALNAETLKNGDNTKTSTKAPKQDDSAKKHSNNLMSKVKQSIVKVKKAIIGKSPSSKALMPEAKKDEKVK